MSLFRQAKKEIFRSLLPVFREQPELQLAFENICIPEKVHQWKVSWHDDIGNLQHNSGWFIQQNSALGPPYKGGLRFENSVTLDTLQFLALEQVFKNSLTGYPIGGANGGSDFDPKHKSKPELKRFCDAFMDGLFNIMGPDADVPSGDIGCSSEMLGYLYGSWRKNGGVLSGLPCIRPKATGYGLLYAVEELVKCRLKNTLEMKNVLISGSGNVAVYAAKKAIDLGACVLTMSDRDGTYYCHTGLTKKCIENILFHKKDKINNALNNGIEFLQNKTPWCSVEEQVFAALPCATQNEIDSHDIHDLLDRNIVVIGEGSNMSCTESAIDLICEYDVQYLSAKVANAGGVLASVLEMQHKNVQKNLWNIVDAKLNQGMRETYHCAEFTATQYQVSLCDGANIAGFLRVSDAMKHLGYI